MSVFNPSVQPGQVDDPNYFKYSEPTKDIKADTSKGLALDALGTGISGGASLAFSTAEDYIKHDVKDTIEPIRAGFTSSLEAARANIVAAPVQTPAGATAGQSLTAGGDTNLPVPDGVQKSLAKVQSIQDAYVNGHVNDTWYHGQLNTATTGLRAKYPGFTDYVDSEVSKITGVVPANAYIADLMQDLNRAQTNKKTEQDKLLDMAMTKGMAYDKGAQMYQRLKADPSYASQYLQWYNDENVKDTQMTRDKGGLELKNLQGADAVKAWKPLFSTYVSNKIDSDLNATMKLNGMDKPEAIMSILQKLEADPNSYTPQQQAELATKMQLHQTAMTNQLRLGAQHDTYGGEPFYKHLGASDIDAEITSQTALYKGMADAISGGGPSGFGSAYFQAQQARATIDQSRYNLTKGDLGQASINFQILSERLGPALAKELVPAFLAGQTKLADKLKGVFGEKAVEAVIPPPDGINKPITFASQATDMAHDPRFKPEDRAAMLQGLLGLSNQIKNKDLPDSGKAALVQHFFDPANNANLQLFKEDYSTPTPDRKGTIFHPGKTTVWTGLTDRDTSEAISKLDDTSKNMYRSWVDVTGRELIGGDVRTLNHFTGHDNLYFEWHNENGRPSLVLKDKEGALGAPQAQTNSVTGAVMPISPQAAPSKGYVQQVQQVVDRINRALPNLEHVYKMYGGNTEQMVLQTLQQYGMDFNGHVTGLPKSFGDAVAASRKAPTPAKEAE